MAQVPYGAAPEGEPFPTVQPRTQAPEDLQRIQANPEQFGSLIAKGEQQLGAGASKASQFFGQVAADNASNEFQDRVGKVLYGDPTKTIMGPDGQPAQDTGYFGLRGRAALDARPKVQETIDGTLQEIRSGLQTPEQELQFDNFSRRWRSYVIGDVGRHADQQAGIWSKGVNDSAANLAATHIARNADNPNEVASGAADLISARVRQVQLDGGDQTAVTEAIQQAKAEALAAQTRAISVKDPARAMGILDKNKNIASVVDKRTGISVYDTLAAEFRGRATHQQGIALQRNGMAQTYGLAPPAPTGTVTLPQVNDAIFGQESGHGANTQTSVTGAVGYGQVEPATFRQYAKPGENITVPADNIAVSKRIMADYYQKFNGDPYRIAVAYFSGPGNVAPAGSATPWIRNSTDPTGKTVASYVSDIAARLGVAPGTPASAMAANERFILTSDAPDDVKQQALAENARFFRNASIAAEADAKGKKEADDSAANKILEGIDKAGGVTPQIANQFQNMHFNDPRWRITISSYMDTKGGYFNPVEYGPAITNMQKGLFLPPDNPGHVGLIDIVQAEASGDLSRKGGKFLRDEIAEMHNNPEYANAAKAFADRLDSFQVRFAKQQMIPGYGPVSMNLRGQEKFKEFAAQIIPQYDKFRTDLKANPYDFINDTKKWDALMDQIYPPTQRRQDEISGVEGVPTAQMAAAPVPEAPQGVNADAYHTLLQTPPTMPDGRLATPSQYGRVIGVLAQNPTDPVKQQFNKFFGSKGAMADDILAKLGVVKAAAPVPAPTPAVAANPVPPTNVVPLVQPSAAAPAPAPSVAAATNPQAPFWGTGGGAPAESLVEKRAEIGERRIAERREAAAEAGFKAAIAGAQPATGLVAEAARRQQAGEVAAAQKKLADLATEEQQLLQERQQQITGNRGAGFGHTPAYIAAELKRIADERKALGAK